MSSKKLPIGEKEFKALLSEKFIALMDHERGVQSKLAESVNKKSNYFSAVKRGNPVNAVHLKAVELVFGPEKVIELLTISVNETKFDGIIDFSPLSDLVKSFKQKELARELNLNALRLEQKNPEALIEINDFIKFKLQSADDRRKKKRRRQDNPDAIPDGQDRRSGQDRRKTGT